ncbi:Lipopolysaccharide core biosynthesis mannosyltransferase LpcC [Sulfitobacter noctilucicola]|uniref:Mannosyltransferase n=1 Tax=Sulfitobacter noctilucicola TaxID=1342301 RepID=A0A7W6M856_9RHOB|nr:glycosyltransferase family 4 protein [Sulfitobacter noctilucicola]KIN64657.1 Lipopolysaccharide core biosynthesis mannosyltransferase LpcC [Sulfitobacter noctilucicola]MBB4174194.1 mannosyltransferase [Sulfitobacter noctilucicola]
MSSVDIRKLQVIAPNFKKRLSGVTATVVRLVPVQSRSIAIAATGPVIPPHVPQIPLTALLTMPRSGPDGHRVWHARRNVEMIGGLALKYLLGKRLKLVFTSASQRKQSGLTRWLIRRMDAVVATSERTNSYLEHPAQVIMHGIDLDDYTPAQDRAALRGRLGLPDGVLIGCYGRIRAQKGTDAFVDAMIPVLHAHPEAHALVMGRATDKHRAFEQSLKDRVAAEGLSDRLLFLPEVPVEDMADWYRVLDLYVAPQRWEGFGLTPIEAMACGIPVIATRVGAFDALVVEGETGTLVDPDDIPALAEATQAALDAPETLARWADNSRPHIAEKFSIEREATDLVRLYRRLLA